ncbi:MULTISPECIES: helix-turn-helix domain-containing protein [Sphingobacterium]|uniref:helix-turn-helix domain-containing protein n=1 Tax=Sphingobacterium TaxID=28453 RepID=UPI0013DA0D1E|nr:MULTISPECIES: helix-turn-helix domain-containing protein [unclassified Sphingobacterium]
MGIHVGNVLEQVLRMERIGISELSRKLKVSRRTIYNWFKQENLNLQILLEVGNIIGHDFTAELPETLIKNHPHLLNAEDSSSITNADIDNSSVYFWMNKYISLLEKYSDLLNLISENSASNKKMTGKNDYF